MKGNSQRNDSILRLGLGLIGIFIFLSLITYSSKDTFYHAPYNWGGLVGHIISFYLYKGLGVSSFVVPFLFILWGVTLFFRGIRSKLVSRSVMILVLAFLFEIAFAYFLTGVKVKEFLICGEFGKAVHRYALFYIGKPGTLLILTFGFFTMFLLLFNLTPQEIVRKIWKKPEERRIIKEKRKVEIPEREEKVKVEEAAFIIFDEDKPLEDYLIATEEEYEVSAKEIKEREILLESKLKEFDIEGEITATLSGPVVTRYEFQPAPGIKVSKISSLADDLSLSMKAERMRILAPIPGKSVIGIEVPNKQRKTVRLKNIIDFPQFKEAKKPLVFALGATITGEPYICNLEDMPHLLIAGTTGSGKSVCIHALITSMLIHSTHQSLRFMMIDPKRLELPTYNPLPHLLAPTVVNPKTSIKELGVVIEIMEERYKEFSRSGVRDIEGFNQKYPEQRKPYIVVIIDELADLMLTAPSDIESRITRLAQMSRAVGIHLVLATQRPSVDVITGVIKANFPARIALQVASKTDSRTILDMNGAESLLGKGDMLFLPPGQGEPVRLHGALITIDEIKSIAQHIGIKHLKTLLTSHFPPKKAKELAYTIFKKDLLEAIIFPEDPIFSVKKEEVEKLLSKEVADSIAGNYYPPLSEMERVKEKAEEKEKLEEVDEFFEEAARIVFYHKEASVSMLQRRLNVGWARAGRIIDQLETARIVGPYEGSKSRKVVVETHEELEKILHEIRKKKAL